MIDREKVISAYECVITRGKSVCECGKCDYYINDSAVFFCDNQRVLTDTLALLKKQKEKKGQWIPIESPTGVEAFGVKEMTVMNVRCSVCGSEEDVSFTGYKYCPRCGAKMEGRRSGNEINRRAGHARQ